ncbi:MAG TPA: DUF4157 domain-containing protein [Solirubrobacteraceae bacterium]|jgi:hypothetical protein|nr:DUF4157 domain-containing protein [Solirubrobacteraceae bacterium]
MSTPGRRPEEEREAESVFAQVPARGWEAPQPASAPDPAQRLAAEVGNRAFGALISRECASILADGTVHPEVQAAIARRRGGGGALDGRSRERFASQLGDPLADVRVHTDAGADTLARSMSARAFTTGSDVFFATGEYRPGTGAGDRLLAHELTHVVQQRGAPITGPLTVSEPGDAQEAEAEAVADELTG